MLIRFVVNDTNRKQTNLITDQSSITVEILNWRQVKSGREKNLIISEGAYRVWVDDRNETINVTTRKNNVNSSFGYNLSLRSWCSLIDGHSIDELLGRELNE